MRLSSLLNVFVILFCTVALALGGSAWLNHRNHELASKQLSISHDIHASVVNLSTLGAEYAVHYRERTAIQWSSEKEKLSLLMLKFSELSPQKDGSYTKLRTQIYKISESFDRLQDSVNRDEHRAPEAKKQAVKLFTGQLMFELQQVSLLAEHLNSEGIQASEESYQTGTVIAGVATLFILLSLLFTLLLINTVFIKPGRQLRKAIATIEKGQLDHRLPVQGPSEFRDISTEFNQMLDGFQRVAESQELAEFGHWEWNIKSGEIVWSDGVFHIFGYKPQSFTPTYDAFLEMIHPEDKSSVELAVNNALVNKAQYEVDHRIILSDGSEKIVKEQGKIVLDQNCDPIRMIGTVQDISIEQEAKKALEAREILYKQMFEMNTAIKLLIDPASGQIINANRSACLYYGYPLEEFKELKIFEINTLTEDEVIQEMDNAKQEKRRFFRFKHKLANGDIRDVEVHSGPVEVEGKSLLHSIVTDVTERNRYEAELKEASSRLEREHKQLAQSQQQYRSLFNTVSVGIVQQNIDGQIIAANDKACEILDLPKEEILSRTSANPEWKAVHEDGSIFEGATHPAMLALASGEPQLNVTMGLKYPDEVRWILIDSIPLIDERTKETYSVISNFSDITNRLAMEQALLESETRNELAQKLYGIGVWQWNAVTNDVFWSKEMCEMWGIPESEFKKDLDTVQNTVHPDDWAAWQADVQRAVETNTNHELEFRIIMPDGAIKWIYALGKPIVKHGINQGMFGICTDVTEKREQFVQLTRAANVFANAQEGIIITDAKGVIIETNRAFTEITGFEQEEVIGETPRLLKSGKHADGFYQSMWSSLIENGHWEGELWNKTKDGELYAENLTISSVLDQSGDLINYVGVFSDITVKKLREEALEKRANYDPLTELPNRRILDDALSQKCQVPLESGLVVMFIDLDGFKEVNDTYGHSVGDELLVAVSKRIKAQLRSEDIVSRVGGDEFVLLANDIHNLEEAQRLAERILKACSSSFSFESGDVSVSASIGATFAPEATSLIDATETINKADEAMYKAKNLGKNQAIFL